MNSATLTTDELASLETEGWKRLAGVWTAAGRALLLGRGDETRAVVVAEEDRDVMNAESKPISSTEKLPGQARSMNTKNQADSVTALAPAKQENTMKHRAKKVRAVGPNPTPKKRRFVFKAEPDVAALLDRIGECDVDLGFLINASLRRYQLANPNFLKTA